MSTELLEHYKNLMYQALSSTDDGDRSEIDMAINTLYIASDFIAPPKHIIYCESPFATVKAINAVMHDRKWIKLLKERGEYSALHVLKDYPKKIVLHKPFYNGLFEAPGLFYSKYVTEVSGNKTTRQQDLLIDIYTILCKYTTAIYTYNDFAFVTEKPLTIKRAENGLLHNLEGPAMKFSDNIKVYAINGAIVDKTAIEGAEPKKP